MHWAIDSLHGELPSPWVELALALAAVLCGAIVGTERERQDKPAGLRTLTLVCLGSAVFTMVSYAFTTTTGDSGRVAAQVVTGVGFLGAGAILHSKTTVSGMTTAAAIWMMAAIGVTVGAGWPVAGLGLAVLVRVILAGVYRWEIRHLGGVKCVGIEVVFDPDHGKTRIRLGNLRETFHVSEPLVVQPGATEDAIRAKLEVRLPRRQIYEFLAAVVDLPGVLEIREFPLENDQLAAGPPSQQKSAG